MKKLILVLLGLFLAQSVLFAETYTVNPDDSTVKWTATKVGGKHYGRINVSSGVIQFEGDKFVGGEAAIDMSSISVRDIKDEKGKKKLATHLKSADFFDSEKFPTSSIKITQVKQAAENFYDVTADVTIKGVTHPVRFQAEVRKTKRGIKSRATLVIDRSLFDVRYGSGKFFENLGDRLINDEFTLEVSVTAAA